MAEPLLSYRNVTIGFDGRVVLDGIDLDLLARETLAVIGPSGVGKTVLLRATIGLIKPDAGQILFHGRDIAGLEETELREVRRHIAVVFQGGALFDSMSVADNVAFGLREHERWGEDRIAARVNEVLAWVGLDARDVADELPGELSGGMRKRVSIARAVALIPQVVLYDEPTTGLDPANVLRIDELIRDLQRRLGVTSLVITHDIQSAFRVSDRMAFLQHRHIEWCGSAAIAREHPPPALRTFLTGEEAA